MWKTVGGRAVSRCCMVDIVGVEPCEISSADSKISEFGSRIVELR